MCILDFGCIYSKITFYGSLHKQGWWFCLLHHLKCLKIAGAPRMFKLVFNAPPKMLEDCGGSAHVQACWQQRKICCPPTHPWGVFRLRAATCLYVAVCHVQLLPSHTTARFVIRGKNGRCVCLCLSRTVMTVMSLARSVGSAFGSFLAFL